MSEWQPGDRFDDTQPLVGEGVSLEKSGPTAPMPASAPPPPPAPPGSPAVPLVQVGDITVTASAVFTPNGQFPVAGSQWFVQDQWILTQKTPTWAVLCAIFGFCVLTFFSLLFLLAKESVMQGYVAVTVSNGPHAYSTRMPVINQMQVNDVHNRVNYARSIAAG